MKIKRLIILAGFIYFLIAPFTYHTDTKLNLAYPSLGGGVWNIYGYLEKNNLDIPPLHYPPLHYLVLKLELPIAQALGGTGYTKWLLSDSTKAVSSPQIFTYNLASKFPLLLLALFSGWLIFRLVLRETQKESSALLAAAVWLLNPITLYSVVAMGQNDIVAIAVFLIGLWFYLKNPLLAFLIFGLAGSIKSYPLIWAGVLAMLYRTNSLWKKFALGGVSGVVYLLTIAPFLGSQFFREQVLGSGLVTRFFVSGIDLGFGKAVLIVPLLVTVLFVTALMAESSFGLFTAAFFLFSVNFVILGFSHFHPQWLLWLMPFWAILFPFLEGNEKLKKVNRFLFLITTLSFAVVVLLFEDAFLSWGIFSPLNPNLLNLPVIRDFLSIRKIDVNLYDNLAHSLIAGVGLFLVLLTSKADLVKEWISGPKANLPKRMEDLLGRPVGVTTKLVLAVLVPIATILVFLTVSKSLPVVIKTETEAGVIEYLSDKEILPLTQKFAVMSDSIYRIEVLFKNPSLQSRDEVGLQLVDDQGKQVASSTVSGFNIGDPAYFRLDFAPTVDSSGKNFTIFLTKTKVVDGKLQIGFSNASGDRTLIINQFSKHIGLNNVLLPTLDELKSLLATQPLVMVLPILTMLFI